MNYLRILIKNYVLKYYENFKIPCTGTHITNGFPVCCNLHEHIGLWFMTRHSAFCPQVSRHGFSHRCLMQLKCNGHSEFITHSGLQFGGFPWKEDKQEQIAWPLISLHWLFGPHGEGWQGFRITGGVSKKT